MDDRLDAVLACVLQCARISAHAWTREAEDIAQEVGKRFIRFWRQTLSEEGKSEFVSSDSSQLSWVASVATCRKWVFKPVRQAVVSHWRKKSVRDRHLESLRNGYLPNMDATGPDATEADEQISYLRELVARLPLGQQKVIKLFLNGLSPREVAEQLGISTHAVQARRRRGLEELREKMQHKAPSHFTIRQKTE